MVHVDIHRSSTDSLAAKFCTNEWIFYVYYFKKTLNSESHTCMYISIDIFKMANNTNGTIALLYLNESAIETSNEKIVLDL